LKQVLASPAAYIGLQRLMGADRLRYRCIESLDLPPGATVIDVGCGPAYYFEAFPQPLNYFGFDPEPRYIAWAQNRWGDRATFRVGVLGPAEAASLPRADAVLLLGLLHHLSDEASNELLSLGASMLGPEGRVVAVDTCFEPTQGRISRWMAENDRGEYVRRPEEFVALAQEQFHVVEGDSLSTVTRIPGSYWMMTMSRPREQAGARAAALGDRRDVPPD
jgi:SAM-dependent methyltransferase